VSKQSLDRQSVALALLLLRVLKQLLAMNEYNFIHSFIHNKKIERSLTMSRGLAENFQKHY
jgi:Flp pilus assembly protein protease CpaA